jgi:hypothetical protein
MYMHKYIYVNMNLYTSWKYSYIYIYIYIYIFVSRFDRFYSNQNNVSVDKGGYKLLGRETVPGVDYKTSGYHTPSDHYGIMVRCVKKSYLNIFKYSSLCVKFMNLLYVYLCVNICVIYV